MTKINVNLYKCLGWTLPHEYLCQSWYWKILILQAYMNESIAFLNIIINDEL